MLLNMDVGPGGDGPSMGTGPGEYVDPSVGIGPSDMGPGYFGPSDIGPGDIAHSDMGPGDMGPGEDSVDMVQVSYYCLVLVVVGGSLVQVRENTILKWTDMTLEILYQVFWSIFL